MPFLMYVCMYVCMYEDVKALRKLTGHSHEHTRGEKRFPREMGIWRTKWMRNISIVMTYDNPLTAERALRALIDFTLSNTRRFTRQWGTPQRERVNNVKNYLPINPLTAERALRALICFTLSNARRFYSSMGNPLDGKGIITETDFHKGLEKPLFIKETFASSVYPHQLT